MDDVLITTGSEVKALPDGKVSGYLVRFSTQNDPDITSKRDFFTKNTDYDLERSLKCTLYFDHGLDHTLKKRSLGLGEMKMDDVGVWVEAQLNMRDQYEAAIYDLARKGKLGWSSGTASHLVIRESKSNGANEILKWPLGLDASLTPTPAEPRNDAVALKSVFSLAEYLKTRGDEIMATPGDPIGDVAAKNLAAAGQSLASLKTQLENDLPIEQHSDAVESAVVEFAKSAQTITEIVESLGERWEARTSSRIKAGRKISASNKTKMEAACGKLKACGEAMTKVHDELMAIGADEMESGTPLDVKSSPVEPNIALQLEAQFLEFQTKSLLATAGV